MGFIREIEGRRSWESYKWCCWDKVGIVQFQSRPFYHKYFGGLTGCKCKCLFFKINEAIRSSLVGKVLSLKPRYVYILIVLIVRLEM